MSPHDPAVVRLGVFLGLYPGSPFLCRTLVLAVVLRSSDTFFTSFLSRIFHVSLPTSSSLVLHCLTLFGLLDQTSHTSSWRHFDKHVFSSALSALTIIFLKSELISLTLVVMLSQVLRQNITCYTVCAAARYQSSIHP